jgi:eukaryotic-like serine/threonine-protein kinase
MESQVTLSIVEGGVLDEEITLEQSGSYVVGRANDCDIPLAGQEDWPCVSRHHCLLAFDPPILRVRDLGSRNGTFLNGECIGQRSDTGPPDQAECTSFAEYLVNDGDQLRVGDVVFRVDMHQHHLSEATAPTFSG